MVQVGSEERLVKTALDVAEPSLLLRGSNSVEFVKAKTKETRKLTAWVVAELARDLSSSLNSLRLDSKTTNCNLVRVNVALGIASVSIVD